MATLCTGLTFKDFSPIIATLITISFGYRFLSVTANKNRQNKWIDDFRNEVARFVSISNSLIQKFDIEKSYEMVNSTVLLRFYLYETKQPTDSHKKFEEKLKEMQTFLISLGSTQFEAKEVLEYITRLPELMTLATDIIKIERNRI